MRPRTNGLLCKKEKKQQHISQIHPKNIFMWVKAWPSQVFTEDINGNIFIWVKAWPSQAFTEDINEKKVGNIEGVYFILIL
jgi:hypothetical protein